MGSANVMQTTTTIPANQNALHAIHHARHAMDQQLMIAYHAMEWTVFHAFHYVTPALEIMQVVVQNALIWLG